MPRPPSHWVRLRQNRMLRGITSRPVYIVIPVVVNPLMVSNMPSRKLESMAMTNGNAPMAEKPIHAREQMSMDWALFGFSRMPHRRISRNRIRQRIAGTTKAATVCRPSRYSP